MRNQIIGWIIFNVFVVCGPVAQAQFSQPSDTLNTKRVRSAMVVGASTYAIAGVWMYTSWYEDTKRTSFHTFDDWNEWRNMDKYGHALTAQYQSYLAFKGARWCGIEENKSILIGAGTAMLLQTTVEVMDGFSDKWGFSWADMGFNAAGAGLFAVQQQLWYEQRIRLKISASVKSYSHRPILGTRGEATTTLEERTDDLFGAPVHERLLKDYNAQTYWVSTNLHSFLPESKLPKWLNISIGIGAENMYGGFENQWTTESGIFVVGDQRYSEFYLSPDIDWTRIETKSWVLNTIFDLVSVIKFPLPGVRYDKNNGLDWRWVAY